MKKDKLATISYNLFVNTISFQNRHKLFKNISKKLWEKSLEIFAGKIVTTTIHEKNTFINYGYTYPIICREYPTYNLPLVELAYLTYLNKASPLTVVDIGAAIGDTVLLLESSLPQKIEKYYCIDGDKDFFSYLQENLSSIKYVSLINVFLSASNGKAKNLVKIHPGTASAQGNEEISTTTVDQLVINASIGQFDLLKIDVDGFDGRVLLGAKESLIHYKPSVIFEWHPLLCLDTGNNWIDHFKALDECGYDRYIFFDNYGNFSHFMTLIDYQAINLLAQVCLSKKHSHAVYFDIVAIHKTCEFNLNQLAALDFARSHKHPF